MKLKSPYCCDYCGAKKGETNHWWLRPVDFATKSIYGVVMFVLRPWDHKLADEEDPATGLMAHEHICSEQCVIKAISQYLSRQNAAKLGAGPLPVADLKWAAGEGVTWNKSAPTPAIEVQLDSSATIVLEEWEKRMGEKQNA